MRSDTKFLKLLLTLCVAGIVVSGYLLWIHIRFTTGEAGLTESCSILPVSAGTGCANVAVSDFSSVLGVPLAALAMSFYFTLLILGLWAWQNLQAANEPLYFSFFLSTLSILVTVTMFTISNFVLKAFCPFCAMLWLINLSIWPCLVKQLGLNWGNALGGNLELFGLGKLKLQRSRLVGSATLGLACLLILSVVGAAAKHQEGSESAPGETSLVSEYQAAQLVMLPSEAYGGPTSKGFHGDGAPVMEIAELADFQCPGCRMAGQLLRPFMLKHGDKVRLTFHNFPLDGSCNPYVPNGRHPFACIAAKGSLCAARQGKFWEFHDQVYDHQEEISPSRLEEIANKIGLNVADWQACQKDGGLETQLQKDMQYGDLVGLQSTPTLIVNGHKLVGAHSPAELEKLLKFLENGGK
jgi:protein-disulfide isomerase/uncharacterized membrane protein